MASYTISSATVISPATYAKVGTPICFTAELQAVYNQILGFKLPYNQTFQNTDFGSNNLSLPPPDPIPPVYNLNKWPLGSIIYLSSIGQAMGVITSLLTQYAYSSPRTPTYTFLNWTGGGFTDASVQEVPIGIQPPLPAIPIGMPIGLNKFATIRIDSTINNPPLLPADQTAYNNAIIAAFIAAYTAINGIALTAALSFLGNSTSANVFNATSYYIYAGYDPTYMPPPP